MIQRPKELKICNHFRPPRLLLFDAAFAESPCEYAYPYTDDTARNWSPMGGIFADDNMGLFIHTDVVLSRDRLSQLLATALRHLPQLILCHVAIVCEFLKMKETDYVKDTYKREPASCCRGNMTYGLRMKDVR